MKNPLDKYYRFKKDKKGKIIDVNKEGIHKKKECFDIFYELYNKHYGTIEIDYNLISIHTGGWSENEILINELKETWW